MSVTEPTLTRHADGSITAEWPDPPRPTYEVAHEVLVEYVEQLNELNRLERWRREAIIVIDRYDAIFDLVETVRPARLGDFKSDHVAAFVRDAIDQGLN